MADTPDNTISPSAKGGGQNDGWSRNPVPLENADGTDGASPFGDFLQLARENLNVGRNYFDIAVRKRMEDNLAHAYSRHASGSKFWAPEYDKRSRLFRPKTRELLRKLEAAHALAFHSTRDVLDCQAVNPDDENNVIAAEVHNALLNYRLRETIPWFKISQGALHDSAVQGVVLSCQEWRYREGTIDNDILDDVGTPTGDTKSQTVQLEDTPYVRLIPVENLLLHPSCDWTDPVNSSPFLIEMIPFFANELADRIRRATSFGSQVPYLREFTEQELLAGSSDQSSSSASVRMAREHSRVDRISNITQGQKFRTVWVHRNVVRLEGLDYVYETLGANIMLSEPVPIEEVFGLRQRMYVMGSMVIEPHRLYPSGPVEMVKALQEGINDVTNQRRDNVALALNNRWLVKRGQLVDSRSLMRNVPGSVTLTTDPVGDVRQLETKDVTGSSYQEQDRFTQEFDSLAGQFSQATVGAIKNDDQAVGTAELLGHNADIIAELSLQTLSRTWVEPVLRQLVQLERIFESDQEILAFVSNRVQTQDWTQAFHLLEQPVNVTVSVGFGNTDPMKRLQRFSMGIQALQQVAPDLVQEIDQKEAAHEIFGALGFKDGTRFFPSLAQKQQDPQVASLQKQLQQAQQQLQDAKSGVSVAQIKTASAEKIAQIKAKATSDAASARQALAQHKLDLDAQGKTVDQQIAEEGNTIKKAGLLLEREALSNAIAQADRAFELQVATTPAIAPQQEAQIVTPPSEQEFISKLRTPEAAGLISAIKSPEQGKVPTLPDDNGAGTIARDKYGMIPGKEG